MVCSYTTEDIHLIHNLFSGKKSDDSLAPDFVPSVFSFTSSPRKRKAEVALQRFQRRQNFSKLKEDRKPSHEEAKGLAGKEVHEAGNCSDMENELPSESDSDTLSITSDMLDYEQGANVALDKDCKYLREQNHHYLNYPQTFYLCGLDVFFFS
ncbi:hypothetical protein Pcinc_006048 [Petrolisthes cinctipes]|uniref:Uncharacterized protein n=1 Tax=Petrolisthes cinctipes TaxID=88211 RepID=A0AAE1GDZ2_PETCI|nr:hypothetical protein Pcinc_006048 [Petrolisthes cinctipes]